MLALLFATLAFATSYPDCARFDTLGFADDAAGAKAKATAYHNGALDRLEISDKITAAETRQRDACVGLALQHGADANNKDAFEAPALLAIGAGDAVALKLLLDHHANPNVREASGATALMRACASGNDDLALALLAAGADPVNDQPLWMCAAQAEDRAVAAFLASGKVPVGQLTSFSNPVFGDDGQTALDASEQRVHALAGYAAAKDKRQAASDILYAYYVGHAQLGAKEDPDAAMAALSARQARVSAALKAAGFGCHQPNCGIAAN